MLSGAQLTELRKLKNVSRAELAAIFKCHPRSVGRWEQSVQVPAPIRHRVLLWLQGKDVPPVDMGCPKGPKNRVYVKKQKPDSRYTIYRHVEGQCIKGYYSSSGVPISHRDAERAVAQKKAKLVEIAVPPPETWREELNTPLKLEVSK